MTDMQSITFQKNIPVRHTVDVFIAGGGPAGVAAAVTAARQGRSVYLAEAVTSFGGIGTAGMLPTFMAFGDSYHFYADGIGREVLERTKKGGGIWPGTDTAARYRSEVLKLVYDDMMQESGADFTFQTTLLDIVKSGDRVDAAICAGKSEIFAVKADVFIDCTGDGDLCARAGAPFEKGSSEGDMQSGTLCSLWSDIDWAKAEAAGHGCWKQEPFLPKAFADNVFTIEDPHLPGMIPLGPTTGGGNIGHSFGVDGTDERSLTKAILWGRKLLGEYERFYKEYLSGYENMWLASTASLFGIRETRRILGDYVLSAADYNKRAIFDDEIGRYNYWIDIHCSDPKKFDGHVELRSNQIKDGESYGIPYRTLTPQNLENVLVAGRCVSTDRYVQGSLRVMPGCYITGQAAGMAASIAVDKSNGNVRGFELAELLQKLKAIGAYLPNYKG